MRNKSDEVQAKMTIHTRRLLLLLGGIALATPATSAMAEQVSREQDIVDLRLGQRILVDDGSCPAGQIKEVSGTRMTADGIVRAQKCVPRIKNAERLDRSLRAAQADREMPARLAPNRDFNEIA